MTKTIWFELPDIDKLNRELLPDTLMETLGIVYTEAGDDYLIAKMPVGPKVHQPFVTLHGGATAALAESVASTAANMVIDMAKHYAVGQEINVNHIRPKRDGEVFAKAEPVHLGSTSQVWNIRIADADGKLIAVSRMTMAVLSR